jgi:hypothetical protein
MCFGGGGNSNPYPPQPPSPEQVASDKLARDKEIQRQSYLREGLDPTKPIVTQIDQTPGKVVLGASTAVT